MKAIDAIVKLVPTICATIVLISAHLHGLNHDLSLYVLLAILGIDVISLKLGGEKK